MTNDQRTISTFYDKERKSWEPRRQMRERESEPVLDTGQGLLGRSPDDTSANEPG